MADVRHSTLSGADLHNPKQHAIESDTLHTNTGSVNEIFVSEGDGTGVFQKLAPPSLAGITDNGTAGQVLETAGDGTWLFVDPSGATYGAMNVVTNATTFAVTAAGDATLNTDSQYVKVDTGIWTTGLVDGITFNANGYMTILTNGVYEISLWACVSHSGTNPYTAFKFSTDDTINTLSVLKLAQNHTTGGTIRNYAGSTYFSATAGNKISLWCASSVSGNILVQDAVLSLVLLKAT